MVKRKHSYEPKRESDDSRLLAALRCVPDHVFVNMVTKSGLPAKQARQLCQDFKALKG